MRRSWHLVVLGALGLALVWWLLAPRARLTPARIEPARIDTVWVPRLTQPAAPPAGRTDIARPRSVTKATQRDTTAKPPRMTLVRLTPRTITVDALGPDSLAVRTVLDAPDFARYREVIVGPDSVQMVRRTWAGRQLYRIKSEGPAAAAGGGVVLLVVLLIMLI